MASDDFEQYAKDPRRLSNDLRDQMEDMCRVIDDDEEFCKKDIDSTMQYLKEMEKKFVEKFRDMEAKLDELRKENEFKSEENRTLLQQHQDDIQQLIEANKHREAWQIFKDYEKRFEKRSIVIQHIPKFHLNELDIERYFSVEPPRITANPAPVVPTPIPADTQAQEPIDDTPMTSKQTRRSKKDVEALHTDKDNEEVIIEKTAEVSEDLTFGIRSRLRENQLPTNTQNTAPEPQPVAAKSTPSFVASSRLASITNKSNRPTASSRGHNRSIDTFRQSTRQDIPQPPFNQLLLNPVAYYQHDPYKTLLMACNYNQIIFFKNQRNRLDQWQLGVIERAVQTERALPWHDGLIISMGCIENDLIYMFTEHEFYLYSISQQRKRQSRILTHGKNDDNENTHSSSVYQQRGIGTVDDKYWYHLYYNRSSNWILSKTTLDRFVHFNDTDLTHFYPDVQYFLHFCAHDKRLYFLVQNVDLSYAVISYPVRDSSPSILLLNAQKPLTIFAGFSQSLNAHLFFVNDPSANILHIILNDRYLRSYPLRAYAMCYLAEKNELLLATDQSIQSMNLDKLE